MPKGDNPNSRHNKPQVPGIFKRVKMPQSYWDFAQVVGAGNMNEGVREMVRAIKILAEKRLEVASKTLGCSPEEIESRLNQLFPQLPKGRKTAQDLIQEICLGECNFVRGQPGIIRLVKIASIDITNPALQHLWELRQEYPNKVIERNLKGVSEKIQGDEIPIDAALRGVREELGLSVEKNRLIPGDRQIVDNPTSAYQGIKSNTIIHPFVLRLNETEVLPEYREVQANKTTVFGWRFE